RSDDTVKVVVRVRPLLSRETSAKIVHANKEDQTVTVVSEASETTSTGATPLGRSRGTAAHSFKFDHVYDEESSQEELYESTARPIVESCLEGYNATIFAYGQTGTGKTYTMTGADGQVNIRGIIPRSIEQIFGHVSLNTNKNVRFLARASCIQIYQEAVIPSVAVSQHEALAIREDPKRGVYVDGLSEWVVRQPSEVYALMDRANRVRATGATKMNDFSSRQGAYVATRVDGFTRVSRVGKLNLVDLAGSERVRVSGATGQRLEESKKINASLSALGNVIAALCESQKGGMRKHVPYRDSKLTRLLEDSLGGNCRTTVLATISPAAEASSETLSTLKFATRAKRVTNAPRLNEDLDQASLLRKYERELRRLRVRVCKR
ncbi:hypothetical protein AURANDRAFT_2300, partial [Aureococcus anophagefferens]